MKKVIYIIFATLLFTSCAQEFNAVYKHTDYEYKYEFAKQCFARGKYTQASTLLGELITIFKGTDRAEESLYIYAMSLYKDGDYEAASDSFKRCYTSYPKGMYTESAYFYAAESLYESSPEPRLDQTPTMAAIKAYQDFLDIFPHTKRRSETHERMIALQDKLVMKEYHSAKLYYNLGTYFGNCLTGGSNYEACIITAENALKDYPYMSIREDFALLIMKSKFYLAENSVESKRQERYQNAEDECYGFLNEYPESKERDTAEKYIAVCKKYTGGAQ
ncbi:MAG: outer membrane protein assembly factor BamD [Prevotella sp.]|nr:outer membrane protein assembly factor BamD [Prevotella sp.]